MNKALSFIRLDIRTIRPYLTVTNLCIYIGVAVFMAFTSKSAYSSIGMFMVLASMNVTTPFAVSEKSNIDALYVTLSIGRQTVVLGRYLFALLFDVFAGAVAWIITNVVLSVMGAEIYPQEALMTTIAMFFVCSVIQAVQLPIFFKLGYMKAKFISYMPFVGIFALSAFILTFFNNDDQNLSGLIAWVEGNLFPLALTGLVIWTSVLGISIMASLSVYKKREF